MRNARKRRGPWARQRARIAAVLVPAFVSAGCGEGAGRPEDPPLAEARREVDEERARNLVAVHGCGSCHVIAGINSARGQVGPPLEDIAGRAYLAGVLPNTWDNMIEWIMHPQAVDPRTAMPEMGLSRDEAETLAAWLYRQ